MVASKGGSDAASASASEFDRSMRSTATSNAHRKALRAIGEATEDAVFRQIWQIDKAEEAAEESKWRTTMLLYLTVGSFVANVAFNLSTLEAKYAKPFEWYQSDSGYLDPRYPGPDGEFADIRMRDVALAVEYEVLSDLFVLTFQVKKIPRAGAQFLMIMSQWFCQAHDLKGIHWAGSGFQLGFPYIERFLPVDDSLTESDVWAAWSHPSNHWKRLYPTPEAFFANESVRDYLYHQKPDWMRGLFSGGLVYLAMNYASAFDDGPSMVRRLMGSRAPTAITRDCTTIMRAQAAMDNISIAMSVGTILLSLMPGFGVAASKIAVASVGVVGAVSAAGAFGAMNACPG